MLHHTINVETAEMLEHQKNTCALALDTFKYAIRLSREVAATQAYGTPNLSKVNIFGALPSKADAYSTLVDA